jgi:predicted amidophosphoribosyltransferase
MKPRYCVNCQNPIEKFRNRNCKYCKKCGDAATHYESYKRKKKLRELKIINNLKRVYGKVEVIGFNTKNSSISDAKCF